MENKICKSKSLIEVKKIKPEVSRKITFVNFTMTLAIILYHLHGWYDELPMHQTWDLRIFDWFNFGTGIMGGVALGTFFLMSGFLLYNNCDNTNDMWKKVKKRLKTLGIPYLIWNAIIFIYYLIRNPGLPFNGVKDFLIHLTLTPFDGPLWYMFALILLSMPALLIIKLKKHKIVSTFLLIAVCILSFYISACNVFPVLTDWEFGFYVERLVRCLPIYFLGAYGGMHFSDFILQEKYNNRIIIPLCIILFIIYLFVCRKVENKKILWIFGRIQPAIVWFAIYSPIFIKDFIMFFKCSFFAYAIHGPILLDLFIEKINPYMNSGKEFYPIEIVLIKITILFLVYSISAGIAYLLKKTMKDKYFNMLSGGRV